MSSAAIARIILASIVWLIQPNDLALHMALLFLILGIIMRPFS